MTQQREGDLTVPDGGAAVMIVIHVKGRYVDFSQEYNTIADLVAVLDEFATGVREIMLKDGDE